MKARPTDQFRLLEVASLDATIRLADDARRNPAQTVRMNELLAQRQAQSAALTGLLGDRDDARAELKRLESDVALVMSRVTRDTERLASSSNAKEAQGLEHELASLAARKNALEDAELEIMERLETTDAAVAEQEATIAAINDEGARVSAEGKAAVAAATAAWESATRDRGAVAAQVPEDLLGLYERLGARGVGVGLLRRRTCEGCNMVLSGTDLQTLRKVAEDDVVMCPECGGILVRSDDTGL